jgi:hypothetical protein
VSRRKTKNLHEILLPCINEKLERSLRDYDTLGKILSEKLQFDNKAYVTYEWDQYSQKYKEKKQKALQLRNEYF